MVYNWRRSSQTALAGVLGLILLAGLNVLAVKWGWRWDTTAGKRHSLAPETVTVLRGLNAALMATAFFLPEDSREATEDLFKLVARETKQFTYEFVDPDRAPLRAKQSQISQRGSVVVTSGDRQETVIFPDEEKLVNAIIRVSVAKRAKVLLVTGHGELDFDAAFSAPSACSQLKKTLADQGTQVEKTALAVLPSIPSDVDAVLLLGPKRNFLDRELTLLSDYIDAGGRLLVALAAEERTNLDSWLESHLGLSRQAGLVVDPVSKVISGDPLTPLVQVYEPSAVTRDFGLMTLYPTCTSLAPVNATKKGNGLLQSNATLKPIGLSMEQSWLETDLTALRAGTSVFDSTVDFPGPLWLSAFYETQDREEPISLDKGGVSQVKDAAKPTHRRSIRVLVFGDQDFLADKYVHLAGNLDLARNGINWLLEREGLITVSKPKSANALLLLSPVKRQLTNIVPLIFIPGVIITFGIIVTVKRRLAR